jgi:hypothetical protein
MTEAGNNGGTEFSIELPPREVRQRAHAYMLGQGFSIGPELMGNTVEYSMLRRKRFPLWLLGSSPDFYRVRLSIEAEGEGGTRLTVKTAQRGEWPDVRPEVERWLIESLGGTPVSE